MLISMHKVIGIKCDTCNSNMFAEIDPFKLNSNFKVACDVCETEFISIQKNKQNNYTILINCYVCEQQHRYEIAHSAFWKSGIFALGCHASGIDICYIGESDQVTFAMDKLDNRLESLIRDEEDISFSNMNELIEQALNIIEDMALKHTILCLCENCELEANLRKNGILISCSSCNASEFLKIETDADIENLMKRKTILLV